MQKKKNYTLVLVLVIAITLAVIFWPKGKKITDLLSGGTGAGSDAGGRGGGTGSGSGTGIKGVFPLKRGDKNNYVSIVQGAINDSWNYYGNGNKRLVVDGDFGSKTEAALAEFFAVQPNTVSQTRYNYIVDQMTKRIPLGRRYKKDTDWPIVMGDYDLAGSDRIKKINVGLGVYPFNTTNALAHEFSKETKAALMRKLNVGSVDQGFYNTLIPAFKWAPAMYLN